MVINRSIYCMDLNSGKNDDPVNYGNDFFSDHPLYNFNAIDDNNTLDPNTLDEQWFEPNESYASNNYWYPANQFPENHVYNSQDLGHEFNQSAYTCNESFEQNNVENNQSIGLVRKREDEEYAPCKKQRLLVTPVQEKVEVVQTQDAQNHGTQAHFEVMPWSPKAAPCYFSVFNVNADNTTKEQAVSADRSAKKIIDDIKENRRKTYEGICCNKELNWDDLVGHITKCHYIKKEGIKHYHCPVKDCVEHPYHKVPSYAAAFFASHSVPDFNACTKCGRVCRPSHLTTHYVMCPGKLLTFVAENPAKYYK